MAHCSHISKTYCERAAEQIISEINTVAALDCQTSVSVMNRVGILEGKRLIINTIIDGMISKIKEQTPDEHKQ